MVEYCDRCGTALDPEQPRHQRYVFEAASDDTETVTGRLCSDCFFEFEEWLETKSVVEE
ncbi:MULTISPECIES: hypothetical protein [Halobacterium]|uniref:hypothetical protein n=1 Tax=Halobacterium TaxID=2239 RepID=UPI000A618630|nr:MULTISPECIES: hypothetical protein [Halobacterium]MCG1004494.1 hypothetical protein [Halobacterium noricense]